LTTKSIDDGAPEGEYIVTIIWLNDSVPLDECCGFDPLPYDRLHGLYADSATSTLRAKVQPQANEITLIASVGSTGWNLPRRKRADEDKKVEAPSEVTPPRR
jgi:hypothetical protein